MTDFVLVHGAFRGAWAWDRMRPLLEQQDHRTFAPDLTDPTATLASYIDQIESLFVAHELSQAVLVGHSQGGFVAKAASERLAARISRLVYLDAPVPAPGQTAFDFRPPGTPVPPVTRGQVIAARPVEPSADLSAADAEWINQRLVGQPVAPSMDPVELRSPQALALPESHVFFTGTPAGFPCGITRAQLDAAGTPYRLIEGPHDAIVSHPGEVCRTLLELTAHP